MHLFFCTDAVSERMERESYEEMFFVYCMGSHSVQCADFRGICAGTVSHKICSKIFKGRCQLIRQRDIAESAFRK